LAGALGCISGAVTFGAAGLVTGGGEVVTAAVGCVAGGTLAVTDTYLSDDPSDYGLDPGE
jgi:hypothetical protein